MNKKSEEIFIAILIIIAIVAISLYFFNTDTKPQNHREGKTVMLTVQEYIDDGVYEKNDTKHIFHNDYRSLEDGDTLILKGKIIQEPLYGPLPWWIKLNTNVTRLTLGGGAEWPIGIYVIGNVTDKYKLNETVEIILHIKYYDIYQDYKNEEWHIYGEFPEESIINGEYSLGEIIVPPSQVKKVES